MPPKKKGSSVKKEKVGNSKEEKAAKPKNERVAEQVTEQVTERHAKDDLNQDAKINSDNIIVQESAKLSSVAKSDTNLSSANSVMKVAPIPCAIPPTTQNDVPPVTATPLVNANNTPPQPEPELEPEPEPQKRSPSKINALRDALFTENVNKNIRKLTGLIIICIAVYTLVITFNHARNVVPDDEPKFGYIRICADVYKIGIYYLLADRIIMPEIYNIFSGKYKSAFPTWMNMRNLYT